MDTNGIQSQILKTLAPHINRWVPDKEKIIIGIEGNSGSGKTTLSYFLNKAFPDSCRLNMDFFIKKNHDSTQLKDLNYFSNKFYDIKLAKGYIEKFINSKKGDTAVFKIRENEIKIDLHKQILFLEGMFFFNNSIGDDFLDRNILLVYQKNELIRRRRLRAKKHCLKYDDTLAKKLDVAWAEYYAQHKLNKRSDITLHINVLRH